MSWRRPQKDRPPPPYTKQATGTKDASAGDVHKLVVGFDFGTTYTGACWVSSEGANSKTIDDVHCIGDWPGTHEGDVPTKTPSRFAYLAENPGIITANAAGYDVTPKTKSYTWMKLLLDPTASTKFDDPSLTNSEGAGVLKKPAHKSAVEICADYLTEIAIAAYRSIAKRITKEILEATPIDFWFTVPAVWSDRAKYDTLRAVKLAFKQAGLNIHSESQVFLIREPEAAAIATMSFLAKGASRVQIQAGDSIMICDCGGGTVDIISYKINETSPKLEFEELVPGTGGKCGSTYIDRECIKFMMATFGERFNSANAHKRALFMREFEGFKKDFSWAAPTKCYEAPLYMKHQRDSYHYDEDYSSVKLYSADLKKMFDPVVANIIAMLQSQLDAVNMLASSPKIKTIILAGGFGDSNYLNERLHAWCDTANIRLICPANPQTAIVRGAALSGLQDIQPSARRARMHYGFAVNEAFDPVVHQIRDIFTSEWDGTRRAGNQIAWKLKKGCIVNKSTEINFVLTHDLIHDTLATDRHKATVYCSDEDHAPRTTYAGGSTKLGVIALDFRGVDLSAFIGKVINGRYVRRVETTYIVSFGDRAGVLCFAALVNGVEVGSTTMTFDGHGSQQGSADTGQNTNLPPCAMQ